ncbi:MAG: hypothetical protein KC496_12690, partial [Anaerolineae bacterium]|nr:hypothetical protein [Anaerolineae bacterium]
DFADMARSFLTADAILFDSKFEDILTHVFAERNILAVEDAAEHLGARSSLPPLKLPQALNHQVAAAQFFEESVIPSLNIQHAQDMVPAGAYRNSDGYAFVTYSVSQSVILAGQQYAQFANEVEIFLFGGVTLVFGPDDMLCSATVRMVTDEDIRQVRIIVAELILHNRIANQLFPPETAPVPSPKGLFVSNFFMAGSPKIIKYPVIYDAIPDTSISIHQDKQDK